MARVSFNVPVFTCAWPAMLSPRLRLRIVPSSPSSGIDDTNSGMTLERHAASSICARVLALMRSLRDSPEPLSSTNSGAKIFFLASHSLTRSEERLALPGSLMAPTQASDESVRNNCRAMTLLENLLISRTTSARGGDSVLAINFALDGVGSSFTAPSHLPPPARQVFANTPPTNRA